MVAILFSVASGYKGAGQANSALPRPFLKKWGSRGSARKEIEWSSTLRLVHDSSTGGIWPGCGLASWRVDRVALVRSLVFLLYPRNSGYSFHYWYRDCVGDVSWNIARLYCGISSVSSHDLWLRHGAAGRVSIRCCPLVTGSSADMVSVLSFAAFYIALRLVHRYPMNVSLADAGVRQIMTAPGSLRLPTVLATSGRVLDRAARIFREAWPGPFYPVLFRPLTTTSAWVPPGSCFRCSLYYGLGLFDMALAILVLCSRANRVACCRGLVYRLSSGLVLRLLWGLTGRLQSERHRIGIGTGKRWLG